jgi:hypothetical protein
MACKTLKQNNSVSTVKQLEQIELEQIQTQLTEGVDKALGKLVEGWTPVLHSVSGVEAATSLTEPMITRQGRLAITAAEPLLLERVKALGTKSHWQIVRDQRQQIASGFAETSSNNRLIVSNAVQCGLALQWLSRRLGKWKPACLDEKNKEGSDKETVEGAIVFVLSKIYTSKGDSSLLGGPLCQAMAVSVAAATLHEAITAVPVHSK